MKTQELVNPPGYAPFLEKIKTDIHRAQLSAFLSVTKELTFLYWRIGRMLSQKSSEEGWGAKTIGRLAKDLGSSFPGVGGLSLRNLQYMRRFANCYPELNCATAVAQIPWGHNIILLEKLEGFERRVWYAKKTIENGWSRRVLTSWIESDLYSRQGKAITNFETTLPKPLSELAQQTLKDPYNFDFLALDKDYREKELEQGLMNHLQKFLLELGQGFAFVGRQVPLSVGEKDYYLDLLFYHLKLRCYMVIELKAEAFDPRDAGQINFYLSAVDKQYKHPNDKPSIGMIFCKTRNALTVEYALQDIHKPIGVSGYEATILESLPHELKGTLPTIEEIEAEFLEEKN
ncbi:MAG: hypothetical protein KR126chlam2_00114 [Chlamydiae bacterium]|nr:hypothetical protein [Chlamydiota bacterium]